MGRGRRDARRRYKRMTRQRDPAARPPRRRFPGPAGSQGRPAPSDTSHPFPNLRGWRQRVCVWRGGSSTSPSARRTAERGERGGSAARARARGPRRPAGVDAARAGRPRGPRQRRNAGSPPSAARQPAPSSAASAPSLRRRRAAQRLTCR